MCIRDRSTSSLPKFPYKVENPALQKAEMEWKAEKANSSSISITIVPCILKKITPITAASIANVNPNIYNKVESSELSD